jgi:predicted enzyme related to lactoylglutathione lyase
VVSRFTELVIDCSDPRRVAEFWAEVLDYSKSDESEELVQISGPHEGTPTLLFAKVPEQKRIKNRLHIDVNPRDRDQEQEVNRILALGARRIDIGQGEQSWVVLADPEGNEFCVLASRVH